MVLPIQTESVERNVPERKNFSVTENVFLSWIHVGDFISFLMSFLWIYVTSGLDPKAIQQRNPFSVCK